MTRPMTSVDVSLSNEICVTRKHITNKTWKLYKFLARYGKILKYFSYELFIVILL